MFASLYMSFLSIIFLLVNFRFGESFELLREYSLAGGGGIAFRSPEKQCTSTKWNFTQLYVGTDNSNRWLIGDKISPSSECSLCALRDM